MIQVIERATDILEYLAQNRNRKVPLSEISDTLGIHKATCANIIKTLKEVGLVLQADYRSGYTVGDKIYALAGIPSGNASKKLLRTVKPLMDNLCLEVNENLMLSVIRNSKRILVYKSLGENNIEAKVIDEMEAWPATTAKVIIANYDENKLNCFIKSAGMPGESWPEADSRKNLENKLKEIREKDFLTIINHHFACIAAPIFENGTVVASLGCYLPDIRLSRGRQENIEKRIAETAREASRMLSI